MTTFVIKLIALLTMFVDHIGQFIPDTPEWFRWIGRISAPLFIFCVVKGAIFTSNKKVYLRRLYIFSVVMAVINVTLNYIYDSTMIYITNNFFAPLFLIVLLIYLAEKRSIKIYVFFLLWQILTTLSIFIIVEFDLVHLTSDNYVNYLFWGSLLGNVFFIEGGIFFIIIGTFIYLARNKRVLLTIGYTFLCLISFMIPYKLGYYSMDFFYSILVPFWDFQWMMIAALPFMLLYNNEKGPGLKYFFYVFYPLHILILYFIGMSLR
ncbi:conjugal transfer protein TraX [Bacillus infantis]|uniref:conjugal transfer protein TraX n=1 Tax=Bacillus infantis TaxID=324767 RepID=UPI0021551CD8|nr:conjugal transfer protein TraX [Bacillus infantis]MCR6609475.1 conjugal transfer protein TraX [Bacillus infantis]